mgnify:CR=1 FL=1
MTSVRLNDVVRHTSIQGMAMGRTGNRVVRIRQVNAVFVWKPWSAPRHNMSCQRHWTQHPMERTVSCATQRRLACVCSVHFQYVVWPVFSRRTTKTKNIVHLWSLCLFVGIVRIRKGIETEILRIYP